MYRFVLLGPVIAFVCAACSATPPPRWAEGGAPVDIPRAHWARHGGVIDLVEDGRVLLDGEHAFTIDRAGRVYEPDGDPIAVLQPDGALVGTDARTMGQIGVASAAVPGSATAWLTIGPSGEVVRYDEDGDRSADGVWTGCGPWVRTCTLVTHLVELRDLRRRPQVSVGIGIGMGIGFR